MCNKEIDGIMVNDTCESCGQCSDNLSVIETDPEGQIEICQECKSN